jgi:hypothetical protein
MSSNKITFMLGMTQFVENHKEDLNFLAATHRQKSLYQKLQ